MSFTHFNYERLIPSILDQNGSNIPTDDVAKEVPTFWNARETKESVKSAVNCTDIC